jgi:hypothetical protein
MGCCTDVGDTGNVVFTGWCLKHTAHVAADTLFERHQRGDRHRCPTRAVEHQERSRMKNHDRKQKCLTTEPQRPLSLPEHSEATDRIPKRTTHEDIRQVMNIEREP